MPQLTFLPSAIDVEVFENTKILAAAVKNKVQLRFGCGACRCGTCAVRLEGAAQVSEMEEDERALLLKMGLTDDGSVRLACRVKIISGHLKIDVSFQDAYSPTGD